MPEASPIWVGNKQLTAATALGRVLPVLIWGIGMAARKKNMDFETALAELEQLIEQLESGDLTLDASLQAFEQGVKLTRECQLRLADAEQKVQKLMLEQGELKLEDFDQEEDEIE